MLYIFFISNQRLLQCRKNQVDPVAQHFTHDLKRVQQIGMLDSDQLKGVVREEDQ